MPILLPDECLNADLQDTCVPLSQIIYDVEGYECVGRLSLEHREGSVKFRYCTTCNEGEKPSKIFDCSERDMVTTAKVLLDALYVIANQRNNTEIKPFQPLKEVTKESQEDTPK